MKRRWRWLGVVALLVVAAVGVLVVLFITREDPRAKDIDEAVREYEPRRPGAVEGAPRPGVYPASGEGSEAISFPPVDQRDGAVIPVTVEATDRGCWRVEVDYNEAHWQDWNFCHDDGVVVDRGGRTHQRWDFGAISVDNTSTFRCDPPVVMIDPDAGAGDSWQQSCAGTNTRTSGTSSSAGPYTFVGSEELEVDRRKVATRHYRQERDITGAQSGSVDVDFWFAEEDHLPIRMAREVWVDSASPVGAITYTESGSWQLTTLEPEV